MASAASFTRRTGFVRRAAGVRGAGQQASKTSHRAIHGMAVGNALLTVSAPPGAARDVHPWVERRARALEANLARSVIPREGV
jgi:hypothetical protein